MADPRFRFDVTRETCLDSAAARIRADPSTADAQIAALLAWGVLADESDVLRWLASLDLPPA